jgi:adenosylcobinamide-GDP ribazoletransferase
MMCAFPLVGAVVGLAIWGWCALCASLGLGELLRAGGLTVIPIAVTGGIHLDGLCDVSDALASNSDAARRREILKDPHTGAFAVIWCVCYILLYFALSAELTFRAADTVILCLTFVLSRALSAYAVLMFPQSQGTGLSASFSASAAMPLSRVILRGIIVLCAAAMALAEPVRGCAAVAAAILCHMYLYFTARRKFGGMSGDLAGWFLQICELAVLAVLVAARHILL